MVRFLKRLFCKHYYVISKWHYTHGANGNNPAFLEVEHICQKCGKKTYSYPEQGSYEELYVISLTQLEW